MSPSTAISDSCRDTGLRLFESLRQSSADGEGVTRGSYSAAEDVAHEFLANTAREAGLKVWVDEACNTWLELPGRDDEAPAIVIGSHLDSVRQGGNFDGSAGVFAGLLTLMSLQGEPQLERPVRVVAFRGEESAWFGTCYIGSRSLVGSLEPSMLDIISQETRTTLREAMTNTGADMALIEAGRPLIPLDSIHRYIELHIEQGPVLIDADCPVGSVTGIRGNHRYLNVIWRGEAGHSGAVPRSLRRDAVLGAVEWIAALESLWLAEEEAGTDLVVTSGVLATNPRTNAVTRIADHVRVSLDIRSVDAATLERVSKRADALAGEIASERGLLVEMGERVDTAPGVISQSMERSVAGAAAECGHASVSLPGGAGHDAAALAAVGVEIGMIFVRNTNGSHNPHEAMDIDDFCAGVEVLTRVTREEAR